jgi:hypothetical protein
VRRLGCLALLLPAIAFSVACLPVAAALRAPVLDQARGGELLLAADAARAAAFAAADPAPLRPLFSDTALAPLLPELADLHRHGARIEERDSSRRLVHWIAVDGGGDGVLEVTGEERVSAVAQPAARWSRIVRQWFASLRWSGARWLVVTARDLPPDQWWTA